MTAWTDTDREHAKRLQREGYSASVIGAQLGKSRNAVLGLFWRERLPAVVRRGNPVFRKSVSSLYRAGLTPEEIAAQLGNGVTVEAVRRRLDESRKGRERWAAAMRARPPRPPKPKPMLPGIVSPGIRFAELGPEHCRFVLGEVNGLDTLYCGAAVESERPFCSGHCWTCYRRGGDEA